MAGFCNRGVQTIPQAVSRGLLSPEKIEDLCPILTGERAGRQNSQERIFFAPVGLGFEDALVGWRVFQAARRQQIGTPLTLWKSTRWI